MTGEKRRRSTKGIAARAKDTQKEKDGYGHTNCFAVGGPRIARSGEARGESGSAGDCGASRGPGGYLGILAADDGVRPGHCCAADWHECASYFSTSTGGASLASRKSGYCRTKQ